MQYTTLGRTGLRVSVAGLGCGGNSRLGQGTGRSTAESVALVRAAIDLGVNFVDTAEAYGTEDIVGEAIGAVPRDRVVVSTKCRVRRDGVLQSADDAVRSLEDSLRRLRTDHVDVFHLHAVPPADYAHARDVLAPALLEQKAKGKLRHLGITETGPRDPKQEMLTTAVTEPPWEVVMLAFHMMNQNARRTILPATRRRGVGTLLMFVVRNIFSRPEALARSMTELAEKGLVAAALAAQADPLGFLVHAGGAASLTDAAYRYARHEPGADVVLFGTGDVAHLRANVASILGPPLPASDTARLAELFGHLQGVGLDLPIRGRRRPSGTNARRDSAG
ncbi:MAG: aldo/keto reductase [Alphaproteobacteria bacterium]|nr:aldo/keto reductase [Alphaproteobacteria bacterium]